MIELIVSTDQEAFDHAVRYFATATGRSGEWLGVDEDRFFACRYAGPGGTACVVGSMVFANEDRELLDDQFEIAGVNELVAYEVLDPGQVSVTLLTQLQTVHDDDGCWSEDGTTFADFDSMRAIAQEFGLDTTTLIGVL